jgi:hypothetical protein
MRKVEALLMGCFAVVALLAGEASAKKPKVCEKGGRVTLTPLPDAEGLVRFRASVHGDYKETEATQKWSTDLNGDGLLDRAVFYEGTCGNYGECVIGVYVGCGQDEYAVVLPPDYHYCVGLAKTKTKVKGTKWLDIMITERTEREILSPTRYAFDGSTYRPKKSAKR